MKDLFWIDTGEGRPLVFLHGGFLDHRMWDDQVPVFARRYRVIAPDARGHGQSANATGPFRHTDDLAELLRHLDTGPAILVGLSMGGATAIDTVLEHPELVDAVVISGAGTSEPHFEDPWIAEVFAEGAAAQTAGDLDGMVGAFARFATGPQRSYDDLDDEVLRRVLEMTEGTFTKHTAGEPDWSSPVPDTWERAAQIRVPVHAINGAIDSSDHLRMAERLVGLAGNGTVSAIDGTAHYPNMERPDEFNEILWGLLRTL